MILSQDYVELSYMYIKKKNDVYFDVSDGDAHFEKIITGTQCDNVKIVFLLCCLNF